MNDRKAWAAVALTVASVTASIYLISVSPWYLLPAAWAFAGTAWTGVSTLLTPHYACNSLLKSLLLAHLLAMPCMHAASHDSSWGPSWGTLLTGRVCRLQLFVVGHDCGHRSFSKNKLVEDIVGTLMFMPLIYPFEPWRIKHNHHHTHTNK